MTPAGVRQHLSALEAQGLVTFRKLGGEPNRPTHLYRLSDAGRESLARRYDLLADILLKGVKAQLGGPATGRLMEQTGADVVADAGASLTGDFPTRAKGALKFLKEKLDTAGDLALENGNACFTLYHCPFQAVSQHHSDLCPAFFGGLFRALVGAQEVSCVHVTTGVGCCEVRVAT
jgi:DeoR family suf operon transcriptional repressor